MVVCGSVEDWLWAARLKDPRRLAGQAACVNALVLAGSPFHATLLGLRAACDAVGTRT